MLFMSDLLDKTLNDVAAFKTNSAMLPYELAGLVKCQQYLPELTADWIDKVHN